MGASICIFQYSLRRDKNARIFCRSLIQKDFYSNIFLYQNFFKLYNKLAGCTGTATTACTFYTFNIIFSGNFHEIANSVFDNDFVSTWGDVSYFCHS